MVGNRLPSSHTKYLQAEHFIALDQDPISINIHQLPDLRFKGKLVPKMRNKGEISAKIHITLKLLKIFYSIYNSASWDKVF